MIADQQTREMTGIWKEDEWIYFQLAEEKPKTKVFYVMSKCSDISLGLVKWHPSWRHYCFFPTIEEETVHSNRCLASISEFITEMNEYHKAVGNAPSTKTQKYGIKTNSEHDTD